MKKRILSWLLVLAMVVSLIPSTLVSALAAELPAALAAGSGVDISGAQELTLNSGSATEINQNGTYTVTGSATQPILIGADATTDTPATKVKVTLVLNGLKINSATSPIQILGGSELTLVLVDGTENVLNCTKTGNAGEFDTSAGAGILCEFGAKLTIDKVRDAVGTGSLTVTGGYGGAGIGGGRLDSLYTAERAKDGSSSTIVYNYRNCRDNPGSYWGGAGGQGGLYGTDAGKAGDVTINAGRLTITGGLGGAGIGGGMGAAGEAGKAGESGGQTYLNYYDKVVPGGWFASGGGGGGTGGNGGRGGSGGYVTVNGGKITVSGGKFTLNRNGASVEVIPASIGGGAGGIGGAGGKGGAAPGDPGSGRWAGAGGTGGTGYMNYNGDGGSLTVNGGQLTAIGNIVTGEAGNQVGVQGTTADPDSGYGGHGSHARRAPGHGFAATEPVLENGQQPLSIKINTSENNVRFLDYDNATNLSEQPTDKNGKTLYEVTLTVRNKADDTVVSSANVEVAVNRTDAAAKYTYKTVSDLDGKATLWLPKGDYSLSYFDVNRSDVGIIQQGDGKTFTVEENNDNAEEVKIGLNVTASASISNTQKVYINNTTTEADTPISIKIDAAGAANSSLGTIKWFREKVNDNTKTYALYQTVNEWAFDASGYDDVTNPNDKGTLTVTPGTKQAELKVLENGRYWLKIPMTVTDPNDTTKSMTVNLIRLVEVKNIYREYSIQVKSVELDQKGNPKGNPDYAPLKTALGTNYAGSYGFAWDLNGYQSQTLLKNPGAGFDTVQINGLNSKVKWYNANFGTQNTLMNKNTAKTGFEPVTLTLDQGFLTANKDADKGADGQTDPTKYTITYTPEGVPVAEVTIRGVVMEDDGQTVKDEKWSYTQSYPEGVTTATVTGNTLENYRIDKVLVNGVDRSADLQNGSIYLENLQGTQAGNYNDAITEVMFVYVDNTAEITINAYLEGTTTQVDGLNQIKVRAEIGKPFTYPQPTVSGYDNVGVDPKNGTIDRVAEQDNVINFYYLKSKGNVTYQAVDADGNTPLATKTETIAKGGTVDTTTDKANTLFTIPYYTLTGEGNPSATTYNGKEDVTVTYTYTRNTHKLTVVKKDVDKDVDSEQAITGAAQEITNVPAGKTYTFGATEITAVDGYTAVAELNPTSHMMGDADESITFWYRKNEANRYVTITVESVCKGEVFKSYSIPAFKDVSLTVPAPTWMGYKVKDSDQSKTITPNADETIQFEYELDSPRTITVELNNNTEGGTFTVPGYKTEYVLKKGDTVTIQAPVINGYALLGTSTVTVKYDDPEPADNRVVFNYAAVKTANFVTHTIVFKNHNETFEFYRYSTLVTKSDTDKTTYKASDVQNVIAGYKLQNIRMKIEGDTGDTTNETSVTAPNNKNVEIVYRFVEDTSRIVIKKVTSDEQSIGDNTVLSGYRTGLTNVEVTAPLVEGYALASTEKLTKSIDELKSGDNEITFKYDKIGNVTFTLKEHNDATGKDETIVVRNGEKDKTYDPTAENNPLNLSAYKYKFLASERANDRSFKPGGNHSVTVTDTGTPKNYDVYYTKGTRPVTFIAVDSAKYPQPADMTQFDADKAMAAKIAERTLTERARIGEMYKASAQSVDRYALDDQVSKYYTVDDSEDTLYVYFWYKAKSVGTVTVHYHTGLTEGNHDKAELLLSYSMEAVVGEKVIVNLPQYLMGGKYKLPAGTDTTQTVIVDANGNTVDINYEANFVTVNVKTKRSDAAEAAEYASHEVNKTDDQGKVTGNLTLTPPYREGYTLVGITGVTGGTATSFPDSYQNGKLTLTGLTHDTIITYHYNKTSATEYQSDLTIEYKYNGYDLAASKTVKVNLGEANTIDVPTFEGYEAETYQFTDGTTAGTTPGRKTDITTTSISVTPTQKTGTLVITYIRPDGSVVLPGEDGKIPAPNDKDNVVVKPGDKTPTIDGDGNVKIDPDDKNSTVTRPIDPTNPDQGKEEVKVPGGTVIKPDGTIELPDNGGTIKPEDKLPEKTPDGYISVIYKANGGSGDDVICLVKNDAAITAIKNPFSNGNQAFKYWNTKENGVGGTIYLEGDAINGITGKSVTLYAQWGKSTTFKYSAKLIYLPNDGSGEANKIEDTVGTNGTNPFSENLRAANTFTVAGWTFGGWNTAANGTGTLKAAKAIVEVTADQNQTWHAQWYKVNADGSITVPGKDGNPNTAEDTTANGNGKKNPERDDATGNIKVPEGGSVTLPDGTVIGMPDGGILKPDGTVIITRPGGGTITIPGKTDPTKPDVTDKDGNEEKNPEVVTMTYHSNDGTDKVVNVKAVKGEKISIIASPFKWDGYTFLNWMGTDKQGYNPADEFTAREMEFFAQWYKKDDSTGGNGSIELPGKDGAIEPPHDKDNVIVTPGNGGTLDGPKKPDGRVEVENGGATVTRPDPTDPKFPNGSKEDIKVPEGSTVYPDGTIRLPDGTTIKPEDKYPTEVIPKDYVIVTYEPNGGNGNVVHQMVKINEATAVLAGTSFTAPRNQEFEKWLDAASGKSYVEGDKITAAQDVTLTAQWKTKATTPTTYSATVVLVPNTGDASFTQTLTSMSSQMVSGALDAYADHFTAPEGWTFMGWSTAKAASQNATFYENGTTVTLRSGTSMTLYAILYKVEDTGVVKLPGADGEPNGVDDVTVTPAEGSAITPGKGYMEAPKDSQIKQPAGTITVIEGTVKVYPDGSVFVPDGSKVIDKAGNTITGPATIDKDGETDVDNTKPIQKPDGTIVLPGTNGKIGDEDDIIIKPAGPNTPAGRIDGNGNVTITNPDGADVTIPGNTPADVKVPNGTVITPDGKVTLLYTIRYVDRSGNELRPADQRPLAVGAQQNVKAREIAGYTVASAAIITITAALRENLSDYTIDFVYARNATTILTLSIDPNNVTAYAGDTVSFTAYVNGVPSNLVYWSVDSQKSTISNGVLTVGSDETSGAVLNVRAEAMDNTAVFDTATVTIRARSTPVGPTEPGKPNQPTNPSIDPSKNPATGVTLPEYTGVAKWLETENHIAYMSGVGAGRFEPNANMTRAQVAQMFYNLLKDKGIAVTASFSDVPSDKWYSEAVNALASLGIIQGSNGKFRPNDPITRAEFVAIAMRFADTVRGARASFTDVSTSAWYYDSIASAVSYGWIGGYSDGSFRPTKSITRAEVVTIVNRMLNRSFDASVSLNAVTNFSDVPVTHWAFAAISEATTSHDHTFNSGVESWR